MTELMHVDVVDTEAQIFSGEVEYLIAPAYEGEIGVYPRHIPLITKLKSGVLRLQLPEQATQLEFFIHGGFMEVQRSNVTVLADTILRTDDLDEERLNAQKNEALNRLKHAESSSSVDVAKAQASLEIAIAQLKALDYIKKRIK